MKIHYIIITFFTFTFSYSQNYYNKAKNIKVDTLNLQDYPNKILLCDSLKETSALQYVNGFLYTINDGSGKAEVYKLDPKTGKIIQTIILNKAKNVDWEALTYDGKHLYIGDFGNNLGDRNNLAFYKFKLSKINNEKKVDTITPDYYLFSLDDQIELITSKNNTTNFDIESFVFDNDQLHIFTKEWNSGHTKHETLETYFKFQITKIVEEFEIETQITDASLKNGVLFLTGYSKQGFVYLYKFKK